MTDALLPCPFCGCTNVYPVSPSLGHSSWRVFCDDCHAEGPQIPSCNSDEGEARCQWVWQIRQSTQSNAEIIAENKRLRAAIMDIKDNWEWWQVDTYDRCGSVVADAIQAALQEHLK